MHGHLMLGMSTAATYPTNKTTYEQTPPTKQALLPNIDVAALAKQSEEAITAK
jgi:hypothetical protein